MVAGSLEAKDQPLPDRTAALEALSVVLAQPTDQSVTFNLLSAADRIAVVTWAVEGRTETASATVKLAAGKPSEVLLEGLKPDTEYQYRVVDTALSGRFHTQRLPGSQFTFGIIGDSHPERPQQFDPNLYVQTLSNAAADRPDFFLTIGDDFSVDTLPRITPQALDRIFAAQRLYLSLVGQTAPLFLVNGNHEQASKANLDGTAQNVAVWSQTRRNSLFSPPVPNGFYTGDAEPVDFIGPLRDYYAWTWGDALFVVIDPYWHSDQTVDNALGGRDKGRRDLWNNTLGDAQYAWLKQTLESSPARFKFVFSHHVLGTGRGGAELASTYEWGGGDQFRAHRPGWELPIHPLFVKTKVTAFIQGHDHLFANQLLDGVTYLTLPEPADPHSVLYNSDAYRTGDRLPNSGRVRFTVGPTEVKVEYLREWLPGMKPQGITEGVPAYQFTIPASGPPTAGIFDPAQKEPGSVAEVSQPPKDPAKKGKKP
jgi:hypothetical protein